MVRFVAEAVNQIKAAGLDYKPWGFKGTKLQFRGPSVDLDAPFVAVLGGTETYGKYVETPFPSDAAGLDRYACCEFRCTSSRIDPVFGGTVVAGNRVAR